MKRVINHLGCVRRQCVLSGKIGAIDFTATIQTMIEKSSCRQQNRGRYELADQILFGRRPILIEIVVWVRGIWCLRSAGTTYQNPGLNRPREIVMAFLL